MYNICLVVELDIKFFSTESLAKTILSLRDLATPGLSVTGRSVKITNKAYIMSIDFMYQDSHKLGLLLSKIDRKYGAVPNIGVYSIFDEGLVRWDFFPAKVGGIKFYFEAQI